VDHSTRDAKIDALKQVPLFEGLSKKELRLLAGSTEDLDLQPGAILCREGGLSREFFVLVDGEIEVTKQGEHVATLSAPNFIGEIGLITHSKRTATVKAVTPIRCFVLTSRDFTRTLDDNRGIERKVLQRLAERVAVLAERVAELSIDSAQ
jgi:CRP-like cAMP-binding protein